MRTILGIIAGLIAVAGIIQLAPPKWRTHVAAPAAPTETAFPTQPSTTTPSTSKHAATSVFQPSTPSIQPALTPVQTAPSRTEVAQEDSSPAQPIGSYSLHSLTPAGIITWTNMFRASNNLPALAYNATLAAAARLKAQDILDRQYFEHTAPDGTMAAGDLAKAQGYEYAVIGENLALGGYKNDQDVVQAWMNSPGHRANILKEHYEDIGVGVVRGMFNGEESWVAVQIFGRPLAACPSPDTALKAKIELYESNIDQLESTLNTLKSTIDSARPPYAQSYRDQVDQYNELATFTNSLVGELKRYINTYNTQVANFNMCVAN